MSAGPVLIVDDSRLIRESLARMFEHEGYGALTAANGREAWASMYQAAPSVILLDLSTPQRDAVIFLRLLRGNDMWHAIPVVAINSNTLSEHLAREAKSLGVEIMSKIEHSVDSMLSHVREATGTPSAKNKTDA
jgi:CheY-like chemotaxis protein